MLGLHVLVLAHVQYMQMNLYAGIDDTAITQRGIHAFHSVNICTSICKPITPFKS